MTTDFGFSIARRTLWAVFLPDPHDPPEKTERISTQPFEEKVVVDPRRRWNPFTRKGNRRLCKPYVYPPVNPLLNIVKPR